MPTDQKDVIRFITTLLAWFERHGRHDLPWQKKPTPYRVWVSEIMLQQTQVTTVIPYYRRFVQRFATVQALALAPQDDVLAHWSGLGYYARARNLHRTAQIIHTDHNNRFPSSLNELCALPGIGRSTAGAILALARNKTATILDGNVRRVLARYHAISGWPGKASVLKQLWQVAHTYTPTARCNEYTQAIMDLGALICTRTQPKCALCPVSTHCKACKTNTQHAYPTAKPKINSAKRRQRATRLLLLYDQTGALLLEKRPPLGIWGGLWSLPECPLDANIAQWCRDHLQCAVQQKTEWPIIYHQFSHFRLIIQPWLLQATTLTQRVMESDAYVWYRTNDSLPGGVAAPVANLITKFKHSLQQVGYLS